MLNRFLYPVPITNSLMSGLPMRWTCWKVPELDSGKGDRRTVTRGREVVAHTPIVAAVEVAGSIRAVLVRSSIGTSIAIEFTAYPETVSAARFAFAASSAGERTGNLLVLNVSNAPPRSI